MKGYYALAGEVTAKMPRTECTELLWELWNNSTFGQSELSIVEWKENKIELGSGDFLPLSEGEEYTLSVTERGVGILGRDRAGLMRGFMALLLRFIAVEMDGKCLPTLPLGKIRGKFSVGRRMLHVCLFPEHDFVFIRRLLRYACMLQYTHIVLEFWGTYRFECFPELGWENAYTRGEVELLIREIRALGAEPVPMFNSLGHAPGSRGCSGKHVVLDQAPELAYLFTPDGWAWDIASETVFKRLAEVRRELCELFGDGEYFMIGCDEAEVYTKGYRSEDAVAAYLGRLTESVVREGRKPIIWGDMLLHKGCVPEDKGRFWSCNAKNAEQAEKYRTSLAAGTVIADWQYRYAATDPCEQKTAVYLDSLGYDVIACPFYDLNVVRQTAKTVRDYKLYGYMQTMWDRLHECPGVILNGALECGLPKELWLEYSEAVSILAAAVWRKLKCGNKEYKHQGFNDVQFVKNTRPSL